MTASQKAKAMGLKSLNQVSEMTGQSIQTLINWDKNKPELFKVVLAGCVNIVNLKANRGRVDGHL